MPICKYTLMVYARIFIFTRIYVYVCNIHAYTLVCVSVCHFALHMYAYLSSMSQKPSLLPCRTWKQQSRHCHICMNAVIALCCHCKCVIAIDKILTRTFSGTNFWNRFNYGFNQIPDPIDEIFRLW